MNAKYPSDDISKQFYDKRWYRFSGPWRRALPRHVDAKGRAYFITTSINKYASNREIPLKIIELGCGTGWMTKILSKYGDATGADLSVRAARRLYPTLTFIEADIIKDEIKGKYDLVVSSEVIAHLKTEDQHTFIKRSYELLKVGGLLVLTTPNKPYEEQFIKESRGTRQPIENSLTQTSLNALLTASSFKTEFIGPILFPSVPLGKLIRRYKPFAWAMSAIPFPIYRVLEKTIISSGDGLRLGVVARKVGSNLSN